MSSSMKNAAKAIAKPHRERGQLQERQRLGLLEKHKDYAKRAKDYKKKQATLKSLKQKAADRNEDEFYFGMMSRSGPGSTFSRGKKGFDGMVAGDRGNKALSMEAVRLLKTQDIKYVRTMRNVAAKQVKDLEERAIMTGAQVDAQADRGNEDDDDEDEDMEEEETRTSKPSAPKAKKIVFLDDVEERDQVLNNLPDRDRDEAGDDEDMEDAEVEEKSQLLDSLRRKLRDAKKKLKALADAEHELEIQQAKMAKTATSGGITKTGKRIRVRERKR